ncbi:alpha/beta hydrolase [Mycolicibacterium agri]|uniref:Alpha/beta hydrolase n=2 Tax=Mycolicibacterium agri TaxID=36811 RepID=A0A2A7MVY0_MYCAG|nr:alpha/beta hydrolase [Mycolicibacterium agri]PEG35657.1 alpha/beta hydrolase [Mycolicibacterium agri]GFG50506.1 peroxidase [Mycolicibacterium agri]
MATPEPFVTERPGGVRIVADRLGDARERAVVFLHGGGQTRRSWAKAAAAMARRGWQAVTVDFRGHGESDWSAEGDYRVVTFAEDVRDVLAQLPPRPVLVGASLGGFTSMLLAGELARGIADAVVLVDIVPNMNPSGAERIHNFMVDRMVDGFASLEEVADMIAEYNPHRPRPTDLNGLRANLRRRGDRWYWHWDPQFIDGTAARPPIEVTDPERMNTAVAAILADGVPMLLVRGQVSDLVSEDRAEEFLARFPQVEFVDVQGAGHMVAGDRNDLFASAVVDFLNRHARADGSLGSAVCADPKS